MQQIRWFDRKFNFDTNQNIFPSIIERLSDTPLRMENKFRFLTPSILRVNINGTWSIQENLGHLIDLEPLWCMRLEELRNGALELSPADLQNTKTHMANHNDSKVDELLNTFRTVREKTVSLIEHIDEELVFRSALHPRLKTPMRTMDLFLFVAEHDDHHLARISELAKIID
ncbi:MAG: DinB family protein [Saprospiraceae bacterium]|nr:DinB family protein [Saprospiraceae bacterium]